MVERQSPRETHPSPEKVGIMPRQYSVYGRDRRGRETLVAGPLSRRQAKREVDNRTEDIMPRDRLKIRPSRED